MKTKTNPLLDDLLADTSARVHGDIEPDDADAAERFNRDRTTVNRWRNHGRGSPLHYAHGYIWRCKDPWRVATSLKVTIKMRTLDRLTTQELIDRYWELRPREKRLEGEDDELDMKRPDEWDWLEKAQARERDAAVDEELAAIERLFALRRVKPEEVLR